MLISRIWRVENQNRRYTETYRQGSPQTSDTKLFRIIKSIVGSGFLYTFAAFLTLVCHLTGSNVVYPISGFVSFSI